jgi:hypothetical protein
MVYVTGSFLSVGLMIEEMWGWGGLRYVHANVCSLVFILLWLHVGKAWWFLSDSKMDV